MRSTLSAITIILLSLVFLSACGQKGPLFLPGNPSSLQSIPSVEELRRQAEQEAEDDEDEEENDPITNRR